MHYLWGMMAAATLLLSQPSFAGNFSATCRDIVLEGNATLKLQCKGVGYGRENTLHQTIDLNRFIGNAGGKLIWQEDGGFGGSVKACSLRPSPGREDLFCQAGDGAGGWPQSDINLDERLNNTLGRITFDQ